MIYGEDYTLLMLLRKALTDIFKAYLWSGLSLCPLCYKPFVVTLQKACSTTTKAFVQALTTDWDLIEVYFLLFSASSLPLFFSMGLIQTHPTSERTPQARAIKKRLL